VDLVTADGELLHASADENPDLFWAVRGGGGNYGVVTTFEFRLHPMQREVVAGEIMFPIARVRDVLSLYADYAPRAPDELYFDPLVMVPAQGAPGFAGFHVCYCGAADGAERALAPIRKLGKPASDGIKAADYVAVQKRFDSTDPRAVGSYIKSGFISAMPGDLVAALAEGFAAHPARTTMLFFQHGGGAIRRVANDATAFAHRHAMANLLTAVAWRMEAVQPAEHIQWLRGYWSRIERFTHGFYINDTDPEATTEMISANYRENYPRLASIKAKYDPTNLFRLNANVQPKA
jgi:FAD/FMN-containing dehydrogenase